MAQYVPEDFAKVAVLVTGKSEAALRRFLAAYVKPALGLKKNQWRMTYRECYGMAVLSRPLRAMEDGASVYAPYAQCAVLVLACLDSGRPDSGRAATRKWLKANGFGQVAELEHAAGLTENESIDLGAELVNFLNLACPWRTEGVEDIEVYLAEHNKPFWA